MKNKILIIEDDYDLMDNLIDILEIYDYDVITAMNGKEGIRKAVLELPDLIICDIMMPEMDGYEVIKALSMKEPTKNIPFIFLTAKSDLREIREGMNMGADDYITKPFENKDLITAIETRIKKQIINDNHFSEIQDERGGIYKYNEKIWILNRNTPNSFFVDEIIYIEAQEKYSNIHLINDKKILVRKSLKEWEEKLPISDFKRIHRSTIINLNYVRSIEPWNKNSYRVLLKNNSEVLDISTRYTKKFFDSFLK